MNSFRSGSVADSVLPGWKHFAIRSAFQNHLISEAHNLISAGPHNQAFASARAAGILECHSCQEQSLAPSFGPTSSPHLPELAVEMLGTEEALRTDRAVTAIIGMRW
jgi:hypothetical protein